MIFFLSFLSKISMWFSWRETSWCTWTECSQIPVRHRPVSSWSQGGVKFNSNKTSILEKCKLRDCRDVICDVSGQEETVVNYSLCVISSLYFSLCFHRKKAVTPQMSSLRDRQRRPASLVGRIGTITELQEMQDALLILRRAVKRQIEKEKSTEEKDTTTRAIKWMRIIWNKSH